MRTGVYILFYCVLIPEPIDSFKFKELYDLLSSLTSYLSNSHYLSADDCCSSFTTYDFITGAIFTLFVPPKIDPIELLIEFRNYLSAEPFLSYFLVSLGTVN